MNCCNPEKGNGWDVFRAVLGWQNTATYGSIISYNMYWIFIITTVGCMLYEERTGSLPLAQQTRSICMKIPGLRTYLTKRDTSKMTAVGANEVLQRAHENILSGGRGKAVAISETIHLSSPNRYPLVG